MDCSGTAVNITTEFGNSTIVCDGEDCPVVVITIHQGRNGSCDATGDYVVSPLAIGCADLDAETSFDVECAGSGTLTQSLYSNADCSGDPTTIIEQNTGCQDGEYITFTCAASNKFIGITIIIAVLLALCSF